MLRAGALYFGFVFVFAFGFGVVRTLALEPRLGEAWAVAIETPFLIAAMFAGARLTTARSGLAAKELLGAGLFALLLQQIAELAMVYASGETAGDYLRHFATVPGMVFLGALIAFALMPLIVGRKA